MKTRLVVFVLGFTLLVGSGLAIGKELKSMQERHLAQIEKALAQ